MNKLEKQLKILSETLITARAPNKARAESPIGPTKEEIMVINSLEDVMVLVLRSNLEVGVWWSWGGGACCVGNFQLNIDTNGEPRLMPRQRALHSIILADF